MSAVLSTMVIMKIQLSQIMYLPHSPMPSHSTASLIKLGRGLN